MKLSSICEGIINESGMSRALSHMKSRPFAILTAFRGNFTLKQNRIRNRQLESAMRSIDAGGIKMVGHWQEAPDGEWYGHKIDDINPEMLEDQIEESYLVPKPKEMEDSEFKEWVLETIIQFNQDAAVFGFNNEVFLIDKAGGLTSIGTKPTVGKISQAYSTIKGKDFVFEGTISPSNNLHRGLLQARGLTWIKQ